jgi:hypothetical protein
MVMTSALLSYVRNSQLLNFLIECFRCLIYLNMSFKDLWMYWLRFEIATLYETIMNLIVFQ